MARHARVKVCHVPNGGGEVDLGVAAPIAVAASDRRIAVGKYSLHIEKNCLRGWGSISLLFGVHSTDISNCYIYLRTQDTI